MALRLLNNLYDKLLCLGVFSLYPSLFWKLNQRGNLKKIAILTRKPRIHVRILIYRTWSIGCAFEVFSCVLNFVVTDSVPNFIFWNQIQFTVWGRKNSLSLRGTRQYVSLYMKDHCLWSTHRADCIVGSVDGEITWRTDLIPAGKFF